MRTVGISNLAMEFICSYTCLPLKHLINVRISILDVTVVNKFNWHFQNSLDCYCPAIIAAIFPL